MTEKRLFSYGLTEAFDKSIALHEESLTNPFEHLLPPIFNASQFDLQQSQSPTANLIYLEENFNDSDVANKTANAETIQFKPLFFD